MAEETVYVTMLEDDCTYFAALADDDSTFTAQFTDRYSIPSNYGLITFTAAIPTAAIIMVS